MIFQGISSFSRTDQLLQIVDIFDKEGKRRSVRGLISPEVAMPNYLIFDEIQLIH